MPHKESISTINSLSQKQVVCYQVDILDQMELKKVFASHPEITKVIHLAGVKSVADSEVNPMTYYQINVVGWMSLLSCIPTSRISSIVFSSSASVYGEMGGHRVTESDKCHPKSVYARTKYFCEGILYDFCKKYKIAGIALRYFNPVGAHPSGLMGEASLSESISLIPILCKVAQGKLNKVSIFGNDYPTRDGTGLRDFIHIMDLAKAHISSLSVTDNFRTYNIGSESGYTVLEMIQAMEKITNTSIPFEIAPRRVGDIDAIVADCTLARNELNWKTEKTLEDMLSDVWRWVNKDIIY